jgi:diacylglycerol kinase family enzyme
MNKRYFINVASAGFGAEITATTPIQMKKALGGGAYTLMGLAKVLRASPYTGRLLVPGEEPVSGEMMFMAVGNNRYAGGGFEVASQSSVDDGLLDLAVLRSGQTFSPATLAAEIKDPTNEENTSIYYRQLPEFTIEADQKLHCNLDGEPVLKRRLKFSVLPRYLDVAR